MSEKIFNDIEREFIREELLDLRADIKDLLENGLMTEEELIEFGIITEDDFFSKSLELEIKEGLIRSLLEFRLLTEDEEGLKRKIEISKIVKEKILGIEITEEEIRKSEEDLKIEIEREREKFSKLGMTEEELKERIRKSEEDLELIEKSREMTMNLAYKIIEGGLNLCHRKCQND